MQQDTDRVWLRVFDGLAELAQLSWPSEGQVGQLNSLLGSVHMIQPFNWNAWEAPYILVELDVCLLWLALMLALPLAQLQQSAFSILRNTK